MSSKGEIKQIVKNIFINVVSCSERILLQVAMEDNICEVKLIEKKSKKRLMRSRMPLSLVIANYRSRLVM